MLDRRQLSLNIIAALAALSGLVTISSTLAALTRTHHVRIVLADAHLTVLAGLSLIYLATLLRRGKYNAWLVSLPIYGYLIVRNYRHFIFDLRAKEHPVAALLNLLLPLATLALLIIFRQGFRVRSEIRSFTLALRRAILILLVAFLYGVFGFSLMDEHDFHQEIGIVSAAHYTVDQFGLTTSQQISPYTKRATLLLDSLGVVSVAAVFYSAISFFAPIRFRLRHSRKDYQHALALITIDSHTSEDFFKLWPPDKTYFFSADRQAVIAYKVVSGTALAVGDPVGSKSSFKSLVDDFSEYCRINDWSPAFIHTDGSNLKLYGHVGLSIQKIGEEALVDIAHFNRQVASNKYFRNIRNKFERQGYYCESLDPPHPSQMIARLRQISDDWLKIPGRAERGFMMGYFNEAYLQSSRLLVLRDQAGQIMAFLNRLSSFKSGEANYDMLRAAAEAPTNSVDFLMLNFTKILESEGSKRVNMGLSPLTGLDPERTDERTAIDNLLHFVYDNADRFYSFQGLARFKSKYEPQWESRYIIYRGGLAGFTKTMNALLKAMRVK